MTIFVSEETIKSREMYVDPPVFNVRCALVSQSDDSCLIQATFQREDKKEIAAREVFGSDDWIFSKKKYWRN